jgi:uncharacterized protein YdaU (DUF1376 family)
MRYYTFHLGDYMSHTRSLTYMEDLAYRRLIDDYHLKETPPFGAPEQVAREIGMADQVAAVEHVLNKFFICSGNTWTHARIDADIATVNDITLKRSMAGKASGEARKNKLKQRRAKRRTPVEQTGTSEQLPITHNPEPITQLNTARFTPPSVDEVSNYCRERGNGINPESFVSFYEAKGWMIGKSKMKNWQAAVRTWELNKPNNATVSEVWFE